MITPVFVGFQLLIFLIFSNQTAETFFMFRFRNFLNLYLQQRIVFFQIFEQFFRGESVLGPVASILYPDTKPTASESVGVIRREVSKN